MAVCSEIHTKNINTLCGQNVELLSVKPGGTYSDHSAVRTVITEATVFKNTGSHTPFASRVRDAVLH